MAPRRGHSFVEEALKEDRGPMVPFFVSKGRKMRDALMRLLEPPIEALGFELLDLELAQAGRGGVLRIFIDDLKPDASVTVEDCAAVSHVVSEVLEIEDPIKGN